jgi:hypothetical protein
VPCGWAIPQGDKEDTDKNSTTKVQVNSSWRFGVVWGHGFPFLYDTLAVGPDVGLFIGTKRKCKMLRGGTDIEIEEQYFHVPVAIKLATVDSETGVKENGVTLGYEFNILLSSKCNISGISSVTLRQFARQVEDAAKSAKLGGSIFLGGKASLFAGCYLMGQLKCPITDFLGIEKSTKNNDDVKHNLYAARILSAPLVELSLGVNIMKWLL